MKKVIITISRQFGSNGQEIGRQLAEYLDIGYYNKEIMRKIAADLHIDPKFFSEGNRNESGLYAVSGFTSWSKMTELSINSQIFEKASTFIQEIAKRESAVIVGRCADYILKENEDCISVFCYSDLEDRIRWSIDEYHASVKKARKIVLEQDQKRANFYEFYTNRHWGDAKNYDLMINTSIDEYHASVKKARKIVLEQDQKRANFYEFYTNRHWGDAKNYDLMINTSRLSTKEVVELIAAIYDQKMGIKQFKGAFQNQYIDQKIDTTQHLMEE